MKKNMLAVLILVLTIVNLSLTAFSVFIVVPNAQRTDELITKVMSMIDLELESPLPADIVADYDIKNVIKYEISDLKANLKADADGKAHYAVVNCSLSIDSSHDDYEDLNPLVASFQSDVTAIIKNELTKYTADELNDLTVREEISKKVLAEVQALFKSTFIVDVVFDILTQ